MLLRHDDSAIERVLEGVNSNGYILRLTLRRLPRKFIR